MTAAPDLTTRADAIVDAAAGRLQQLVSESRQAGGLRAKIGDVFEGDPAFLRKLKPSLIAARARGRSAPTGGNRRAPSTPPPAPQSKKPARLSGGPSPWLVLGAAFAIGIVAAKAIDWRGHAHPRD